MFAKVKIIKDDKKEYKLVVMISTENEATLVHQQFIPLGTSLADAFTEAMSDANIVEFRGVTATAESELVKKALAEQAELAEKKKKAEEAKAEAEKAAEAEKELEILQPTEAVVDA